MWILIAGILILGVFAAFFGYIRNHELQKKLQRGEITEMPEPQEIPEVCCGAHEVCERDSLLAAVSRKVEYYEDEELDVFRGIPSDAYEEDDIAEFREVLYTLRENEVAGWLRSLQLRCVDLPDALKDEAFLIVGERRIHS